MSKHDRKLKKEKSEKEEFEKSILPNNKRGAELAIAYLTSLNLYPKYPLVSQEIMMADTMNFFLELDGLQKHEKNAPNSFGAARFKIFKAVSPMLLDRRNMNKDEMILISAQVKEAAKFMYEVDGMQGMHDPLLWLFFPRHWHEWISHCFNGVGEWSA